MRKERRSGKGKHRSGRTCERSNLSTWFNYIESYKAYCDEYLTKISMEEFRPDKPLWEAHLFKYPTSPTVAGTMVLKVHHSLGDGYSLMGVVLSCLHTASDLTFLSLFLPDVNDDSRTVLWSLWLELFPLFVERRRIWGRVFWKE